MLPQRSKYGHMLDEALGRQRSLAKVDFSRPNMQVEMAG